MKPFIKAFTTFYGPLSTQDDQRYGQSNYRSPSCYKPCLYSWNQGWSILLYLILHRNIILVSFPEEKLTIPLSKYFSADPDVISRYGTKIIMMSHQVLLWLAANRIRGSESTSMSYAVNAIRYYNADIICADQQAFEVITEPRLPGKNQSRAKSSGIKAGNNTRQRLCCYAKLKSGFLNILWTSGQHRNKVSQKIQQV